MSPKSLHSWLKLNADYASIWPHIAKRESPADAKEFDGVPNKLEQFFSPNPGQGDDAMNGQGDDHGPTKDHPTSTEHRCHGQDP